MKDKEIIDLVNNVWKPLTDYDFPKTTNNGITGSCKFAWLSKYEWLVYSESLDYIVDNIVGEVKKTRLVC